MAGQHVVVVGRSTLVGRPVAILLGHKATGANATVTLCHTGTRDLGHFTRQADISSGGRWVSSRDYGGYGQRRVQW